MVRVKETPLPYLSTPISKLNVVLEGDGDFTEGDVYMVRDKYGNREWMTLKNGMFFRMTGNANDQQHCPANGSASGETKHGSAPSKATNVTGGGNPIVAGCISKEHVLLEGGGHFEEGQHYKLTDRHGNSNSFVFKNNTFSYISNLRNDQQHCPANGSASGETKHGSAPSKATNVTGGGNPIVAGCISKEHVLLEGGGHFEEGQHYKLTDRHGNSNSFVFKNNTFSYISNLRKDTQPCPVNGSTSGETNLTSGNHSSATDDRHGNSEPKVPNIFNDILKKLIEDRKLCPANGSTPGETRNVSASRNIMQITRLTAKRIPNVSIQNVVLEGGGDFEEGHNYLIRDRHGNSETKVFKNNISRDFPKKGRDKQPCPATGSASGERTYASAGSKTTKLANSGSISKQNVVLKGGGNFQEGQCYVVRDRHGNSVKKVFKNGMFSDIPEKGKDTQPCPVNGSTSGETNRTSGHMSQEQKRKYPDPPKDHCQRFKKKIPVADTKTPIASTSCAASEDHVSVVRDIELLEPSNARVSCTPTYAKNIKEQNQSLLKGHMSRGQKRKYPDLPKDHCQRLKKTIPVADTKTPIASTSRAASEDHVSIVKDIFKVQKRKYPDLPKDHCQRLEKKIPVAYTKTHIASTSCAASEDHVSIVRDIALQEPSNARLSCTPTYAKNIKEQNQSLLKGHMSRGQKRKYPDLPKDHCQRLKKTIPVADTKTPIASTSRAASEDHVSIVTDIFKVQKRKYPDLPKDHCQRLEKKIPVAYTKTHIASTSCAASEDHVSIVRDIALLEPSNVRLSCTPTYANNIKEQNQSLLKGHMSQGQKRKYPDLPKDHCQRLEKKIPVADTKTPIASTSCAASEDHVSIVRDIALLEPSNARVSCTPTYANNIKEQNQSLLKSHMSQEQKRKYPDLPKDHCQRLKKKIPVADTKTPIASTSCAASEDHVSVVRDIELLEPSNARVSCTPTYAKNIKEQNQSLLKGHMSLRQKRKYPDLPKDHCQRLKKTIPVADTKTPIASTSCAASEDHVSIVRDIALLEPSNARVSCTPTYAKNIKEQNQSLLKGHMSQGQKRKYPDLPKDHCQRLEKKIPVADTKTPIASTSCAASEDHVSIVRDIVLLEPSNARVSCTPTYANNIKEQNQSLLKDENSYKNEVEKYQDMISCKICMERQIEMTFMPCGHFVCCEHCSKPSLELCPICRQKIESKLKTFMC